MPPIPYKTPAWVDPQNASVTDSWFTWAARQVGRLVGADDPAGSVMGLAGALEAPAAGVARKAIKAYHGSPHDFDQFSLSKIGTGEGAQMYGHGLYFGENPDVPRTYRGGNVPDFDPDLRVGEQPVYELYKRIEAKASRMPTDLMQTEYNKLNALEVLAHKGDALGVEEAFKDGMIDSETMAWFRKEIEPKFSRKGKLYEVNIHASPDELLDWDKPLSQQPEGVREKLKSQLSPKALEKVRYAAGVSRVDDLKGSQLYGALDKPQFRGGDIGASEKLKQAGIPGIKYLDQGSRGVGEGTYNYVINDDTLITVARKYGIPLAVLSSPAGKAMVTSLAKKDHEAEQRKLPLHLRK